MGLHGDCCKKTRGLAMFEIRFSSRAIADLEEIKRYISDDLFNPQAASELIDLVFKKIRTLASLLQTGARVQTNIPVLQTYRFIPCKHYLVFYRVEEKSVSVIRILYARRNYLRLLAVENEDANNGQQSARGDGIPPPHP